MASATAAARRKRAVETFGCAADAIGPVEPDMSLFAVTRGQFSMIDAVKHVIDQCKPADITLWTWRIAAYELETLAGLLAKGSIRSGTLFLDRVMDSGMRGDKAKTAAYQGVLMWIDRFGPDSVRVVQSHAKIATVEGNGMKVLLRGSMNLNYNPRFEQLDITEGGPDFDLVRKIESEMPVMRLGTKSKDLLQGCQLNKAWAAKDMAAFSKTKVWAK